MAYLSTHTLDEMNQSRGVLAGLRDTLARWTTALQVARMETVLSQMTEADLKRIGITYADIPAYARKLIGVA